MSDTQLFLPVFCGVWVFIGLIFLIIGLCLRGAANRAEESQRARATGKVVDLVRSRGSMWYPVVSFEAEGRTYKRELGTGSSPSRYAVGDDVEVLYDPDAPARFHIDGDNTLRLLGKIFIWVGIACALIAAIVAAAVLRFGLKPARK